MTLTYHRFRRCMNKRMFIILLVIFFVFLQILQCFVHFNFNAFTMLIRRMTDPILPIPIIDLMKEDRRFFYASRSFKDKWVPGLHRRNCGCDTRQFDSSYHDIQNNSGISSTCSIEASIYGANQKVISYSLYVKDIDAKLFFLEGIGANLDKIKRIYPDWVVRIYSNIPINYHSCSFICKYKFLFWCDITNIPKFGDLSKMNGRVWRYLPLGDPVVDLFISRDLDSTASERERFVVSEWENSNHAIHVIRDSQWHDTEILAGLWGIKNYLIKKSQLADLQDSIIRVGDQSQKKYWDQEIAERFVYFPFRDRVMAHDSYFCKKYKEAANRPFPTQRVGQEFVGHDDRKEMSMFIIGKLKVCPVDCRPKLGKDWSYC